MQQYHDILRSILEHGTEHKDRTGVGTISHFGFQTRFDLRQGFPIVTTKKVPFRWIAEELFWFLSGDTNETNLRSTGVDIWKEWADAEHTRRFGREPGDLGPVYGYLWRSFGGHYPKRDGVDQIARLLNEIETNPNSRRLIVSGWDPRECDNVDLPPCHTLFQFKVEQVKALPDGRATAPRLLPRSGEFLRSGMFIAPVSCRRTRSVRGGTLHLTANPTDHISLLKERKKHSFVVCVYKHWTLRD